MVPVNVSRDPCHDPQLTRWQRLISTLFFSQIFANPECQGFPITPVEQLECWSSTQASRSSSASRRYCKCSLCNWHQTRSSNARFWNRTRGWDPCFSCSAWDSRINTQICGLRLTARTRDLRPTFGKAKTRGPRFTARTQDPHSAFGQAKTRGSFFSARTRDSRLEARPAQTWPSRFNTKMWGLHPVSSGWKQSWTNKPSPPWLVLQIFPQRIRGTTWKRSGVSIITPQCYCERLITAILSECHSSSYMSKIIGPQPVVCGLTL